MPLGNVYLTLYVAVKNQSHVVSDTIDGYVLKA